MKESDLKGHIDTSVTHGKYVFPGRTDYETYFVRKGMIQTPAELWQRDDLIVQVQRHWHSRGQNGCVFAQAIAANAPDRGWVGAVVNQPVIKIAEPEQLQAIEAKIQAAIADPETQVQSLLFPQVTSEQDLVDLVRAVSQVPSVYIARQGHYDEFSTVALRIAINEDQVLSWLMGFGPFEFFPNTRQAPVTEIAIRVKPKPDEIFHRLNQDREAAHLADTPIYMEERVAEGLWQATYERTRNILGGEPDMFSAAKVTFSVPRRLWTDEKQ
ncbi:MAG: hypothetical protein M3Q44_00750 [bacterium]|nr:hypothetical protein [bacterium]